MDLDLQSGGVEECRGSKRWIPPEPPLESRQAPLRSLRLPFISPGETRRITVSNRRHIVNYKGAAELGPGDVLIVRVKKAVSKGPKNKR